MYFKKRSMQSSLFFFLLIIFVTGCSAETNKEVTNGEQSDVTEKTVEKENSSETDDERQETDVTFSADLPDPPNNLEELLDYPVGSFAGKEYEDQSEEIEEVLDQFPKTGEEVNQEQLNNYWKKLLSLFAEDFPDPANLVNKWGAYSFGNPDIDDPKLQFKENYNVEIILDSSGSMAAKDGNKTRMDLAKEAIVDFAESLPEKANVGLRVYGFRGSNADADKEISCNSNELVYGLQPYDEQGLNQALDKFSPTGWTPLADAIEQAKADLSEFDGEKNTNIIYIVSDGVETCDGDPVEQAKSLSKSNVSPIVNVIGFDVDNEGQQQLKDVAEASEGTYTLVQNKDELQEEFNRASAIASKWRLWKANSMGDARMESVERTNMMRDFNGAWADKYRLERHNFNEAFKYLQREKDIISLETSLALSELKDERLETISELKEKVWEDLAKIKNKDFEEAKKQIEEKYDANTNH